MNLAIQGFTVSDLAKILETTVSQVRTAIAGGLIPAPTAILPGFKKARYTQDDVLKIVAITEEEQMKKKAFQLALKAALKSAKVKAKPKPDYYWQTVVSLAQTVGRKSNTLIHHGKRGAIPLPNTVVPDYPYPIYTEQEVEQVKGFFASLDASGDKRHTRWKKEQRVCK